MDNKQEKDKKRFRLIRLILIAVLLVVLFGSGGFYACHFQGGLSSDHSRWSQFGDFFNGVVSPIFAAINIFIFWYLTRVIDLNNDKRQSEKAAQEEELQRKNAAMEEELQKKDAALKEELQKQNADLKKELQQQNEKHEKALILMQFRKAEIDRFEDILYNAFIPQRIEGYDLLRPLFSLLLYLASFQKTKLDIFELKQDSVTSKNITQLIDDVSIYTGLVAASKKVPDEISERITELRYSIISDLQKITLGENT
jgi:flagellar basal body-associated protein FliL